MATASVSSRRQATRPPWEIIVAVAAVVSLLLWPIEIHRAFGLPAHPLIIHVPVIFVPILGLVAIATAAWPKLHGPLLAGFSALTLASTLLAVGAGEAFRADRGGGATNATLNDHAEAGETLRLVVIILTALLVAAMFAHRRGRFASGPTRPVLSVLIVLFSVAAIFFVIRTGHLGAKLAWGREAGGPPPGFSGGLGNGQPPSGGG